MFKLENNFAFLWMMVATYTKSNRYNIGEFFWVIDTREWYRFFAVVVSVFCVDFRNYRTEYHTGSFRHEPLLSQGI